jgi:hypothetical protein
MSEHQRPPAAFVYLVSNEAVPRAPRSTAGLGNLVYKESRGLCGIGESARLANPVSNGPPSPKRRRNLPGLGNRVSKTNQGADDLASLDEAVPPGVATGGHRSW